ncbi:small multi-drug export protein [Microbacterium sp. APC 3898]|uniref:Small multi-drug export protein n=2 Tax=Planococcus TaxID=1372 RepID=A0ABT7ZIM0_9BACL|nr:MULTISPECIES: small multi-drug export protein [Terrabacteria group]MBD8015872.1 small multi-drug export protein [Planococcus wigleyi]MDN3426990.1 small multi-drug export protein [Planococcus sp. APC 4016]MDN3499862.1 small multi-drug export protein [Microbacterium sp. APC 3898]
MIYEYFLVFLGAAIPWFEIALVIPLGIIWGLSPFWVMVLAFVGNMVTVLALIIGFDRFQIWYNKRQEAKGKAVSKKNERAKRIWNKYGLPGLAMLGPILIGTHIAAFIGMTLGATKKNTTLWLTISIAVWTLAFGILTALGFDFFTREI